MSYATSLLAFYPVCEVTPLCIWSRYMLSVIFNVVTIENIHDTCWGTLFYFLTDISNFGLRKHPALGALLNPKIHIMTVLVLVMRHIIIVIILVLVIYTSPFFWLV